MSCEVKIIADSVSQAGHRITTFELYYGRAFHAELLTHRAFSRNSSSSRAIPWQVMRQAVIDDPWIPLAFGRAKSGMQMGMAEPTRQADCIREWLCACDAAIYRADQLASIGVHKSIVNRLIEPFAHIKTVVTATSFDNWFALRCDPGALPDIQQLAVKMLRAYVESVPVGRHAGDWHLPYVSNAEREPLPIEDAIKTSVARCARTSYRLHDGKPTTLKEDITLHDNLVMSHPVHASPAEHQAVPIVYGINDRSGNFYGWRQHRKTLKGECVSKADIAGILAKYEGVDYIL